MRYLHHRDIYQVIYYTAQAAGLIPLTHASGGPLHDIVIPYQSQPTGFHAKTARQFGEVMHEVSTQSIGLSTSDRR